MTTPPVFRWKPTEYPYTERLEWYTRIFQAAAGEEERDRLRIHPRRGFEYVYSALTAREKHAFDGALHRYGIGPYILPFWDQGITADTVTVATNTVNIFVDGSVFDSGEWDGSEHDGDLYIVMKVEDKWYAFVTDDILVGATSTIFSAPGVDLPFTFAENVKIYPGWTARLSPATVQTAITSHYQRFAIVAELVDYTAPDEASGYDTFEGLPLFDYRPDQPVDWQDIAVDFLVDRVDFGVGRADVTDEAGRPFFGRSQRYWHFEPSTLQAHRAFLQEIGGAHGAYWCPTWGQDLDVVAVSGDTITVRWPDGITWEDDYQGIAGRGTIYIHGRDGSGAFRILSSVEVTADAETLLLDGTPPEEPILCSWLELVRLAFDEVAIQHVSREVKEIRLAMQGLTREEEQSLVAQVTLEGGEAVSPTTVAGYVEAE